MRIYNTMSRTKESMKPLKEGFITMYNCGPTVYYFAHIGNLRSYVFADLLRKSFEWNGFQVKQVINITDVGHLVSDGDDGEDKMTKALKRENMPLTLESMHELSERYTQAFIEDLNRLHIALPHVMPKASENIPEDIEVISKLIDKGYAYKTDDGIYFDTSKFANYGALGKNPDNISASTLPTSVSRIATNSQKKNDKDFSLWKFDIKLGWESPWGKGFPGWHIECSAMSRKYLGQPFDIHTGGIDHISIHHNNEMAQSEAAYGVPLCNYWMHNEFLMTNNSKMAKSSGGFITLRELQEKNISPIAYRYWLMTGHYRSPMNFTLEAVEAAQTALIKLMSFVSSADVVAGNVSPSYTERFGEAISNDLDTPRAISIVWELVKDNKVDDATKLATLFKFDQVLGLGLSSVPKTVTSETIPEEIIVLCQAREDARAKKDWVKSDALRKEIETRGYIVSDTDKGYAVKAKNS